MLRPIDATPCPPTFKAIRPRDSVLSVINDDTADIDFTTEFRAAIRDARPKRLGKRGSVAFQVLGDDEVNVPPVRSQQHFARARPDATRTSSMLAQPAQRFRPRVSFAPAASTIETFVMKNRTAATSEPSLESIPPLSPQPPSSSPTMENKIKKPPRRGTIYIPSEDTTIPSIYMGVFSPIKNQIDLQRKGEDNAGDLTGIAAQMARKRGPRSSLASAPKRAPLQQPLRSIQESVGVGDIPGRNTGKENIPPGGLRVGENKKSAHDKLFDVISPKPIVERKSAADIVHHPKKSIVCQPAHVSNDTKGALAVQSSELATQKPKSEKPTSSVTLDKPSRSQPVTALNHKEAQKLSHALQPSTTSIGRASPKPMQGVPLQPVMHARPERLPQKIVVPDVPQPKLLPQYPLLSENISNPSMYEENWLAHQEIAITQLVNNLFVAAHATSEPYLAATMRFNLLAIYQDPSFSLLYKRLQASLLYGALSVPKEVLAKSSRLRDDLGMKRKFLDLWTESYDQHALKAAAEVVVGRELLGRSRSSPSTSSGPGSPRLKITKRDVDRFIETFLIRNEDVESEGSKTGDCGSMYRRTVLRSLLLVLLLDRARTAESAPLSGRLFVKSSPYKSSAAVLQALGTTLIPSVGDVTRPLSHLDYHVKHVQYALEEYEYRIDNLAVDLRDGVRLTRIVELLLYPSASFLLARSKEGDVTTTLAMPTGEVLSLLDGDQDWPLSQHLRFPCIGRATKLFNVQIALSALSGIKGVGVLAQNVTAEDIVDGFREKSVAVLWGLVEKWGLGGLIDWRDVRAEIRRLRKKVARSTEEDQDREDEYEEDDTNVDDLRRYRHLLQDWATAVARIRGLKVDNFTTSFADGKIFETIMNEYEPFMVGRRRRSTTDDNSLTSRLSALRCSIQFATLFAPSGADHHVGHVFDRDFTMAALAFLCSRLLAASKQSRAAVTIQQAWRRTERLREMRKRVAARRLAMECMTVVKTRERLLWAKSTIWGAWKQYCAATGKNRGIVSREPGLDVAAADDSGDIWLSL